MVPKREPKRDLKNHKNHFWRILDRPLGAHGSKKRVPIMTPKTDSQKIKLLRPGGHHEADFEAARPNERGHRGGKEGLKTPPGLARIRTGNLNSKA